MFISLKSSLLFYFWSEVLICSKIITHDTFCILSWIQNEVTVQNEKGSTTILLPPRYVCITYCCSPFLNEHTVTSFKGKNFRSAEFHLLSMFRMQVQNLGLQTYCLFHAIPKSWSPTNIHMGPFSFYLSFLDAWTLLCDQGFFCPEAIDLSIPSKGDSPIHVLVQSGTWKKFKPPQIVMTTFFCPMMRALLFGRYSSTFFHASQAESL